MRGSYTNISGRRCSRLCFGSSNDFIFCSTHSSTSLLRNKKRLPTKSWVSPFLHRYESLANNKNQCVDAKHFDLDDNQNKGVFSWNQRWLYTLRRFKHNCGCMIFMQAKLRVTTKTQSFCGEVSPLLRTAEHISCCLPALLESRAEFSAKWLQKVPKPCDF